MFEACWLNRNRVKFATKMRQTTAREQLPISLLALRGMISERDDALINAIGGEYPDRYYSNLAERLLTLELNNRRLLTGDESLNIDRLFGAGE